MCIRNRVAHVNNNNKPTPGPTYAGGRSIYLTQPLKLVAANFAIFNQSVEVERTTYPNGKKIAFEPGFPNISKITTGFGVPTISYRGEICMLEGVVKPLKSQKSATVTSITQEACHPPAELRFIISGSVDGTCNKSHAPEPVSYTHLRAHETVLDIVCRLLLEKKKTHSRY
eukprot:TRINITY_DN1136_c0_g1_i1.p1 TRINITY_DN1136_c0_g1~~TRINITY_DN1136_c0_g1_i1.p1  ORF type:complete len:171 (+),score=40.03 TRINITY_DN1136_c0_g1_i1:106-618(+)